MRSTLALAPAAAALLAGSAGADVISTTPDPFCPPGQICLPVFGPDVFSGQSIAFRVLADRHYALDEVAGWFWDNDPQTIDTIRLTIRTDLWNGQGSIPGSIVLESIELVCPPGAFGFPVEAVAPSVWRPLLRAGRHYWIAAECDAPGGQSPVWAMSAGAGGFTSFASPPPTWQTGHTGGVMAHTVRGTPFAGACPPDLTTTAIGPPPAPGYGVPDGVVNNEDFFYFLNQFAANNLGVADLTTSANQSSPDYGTPNGVINNEDFFYYLARFAAGC